MSFYSLKCYRRFSHTTVVVEVLLLRHQPSDCQDAPSPCSHGSTSLALMAAPSLALMAAPSPCSHGSTFPLLSWQYLPLALMAAPSPLLSWQHLPLALMAAQHLPLALMAAPSPCSHGSTFPFALMAAPSPCSHGSTFPVFSLACRAAYKFQGSKAQLNIGLSEEEKRELDAESEEDFVTSIRNLLLARHRGSSRYKGVSWYNAGQVWRASTRINRKFVHLGYFSSEEEAAAAYESAAMNEVVEEREEEDHEEEEEHDVAQQQYLTTSEKISERLIRRLAGWQLVAHFGGTRPSDEDLKREVINFVPALDQNTRKWDENPREAYESVDASSFKTADYFFWTN
ncbi:unnamed protein product [Closterium sp. NIES-64]|nr:unnamed protein product [Closterium sp. NIES-64]